MQRLRPEDRDVDDEEDHLADHGSDSGSVVVHVGFADIVVLLVAIAVPWPLPLLVLLLLLLLLLLPRMVLILRGQWWLWRLWMIRLRQDLVRALYSLYTEGYKHLRLMLC